MEARHPVLGQEDWGFVGYNFAFFLFSKTRIRMKKDHFYHGPNREPEKTLGGCVVNLQRFWG